MGSCVNGDAQGPRWHDQWWWAVALGGRLGLADGTASVLDLSSDTPAMRRRRRSSTPPTHACARPSRRRSGLLAHSHTTTRPHALGLGLVFPVCPPPRFARPFRRGRFSPARASRSKFVFWLSTIPNPDPSSRLDTPPSHRNAFPLLSLCGVHACAPARATPKPDSG